MKIPQCSPKESNFPVTQAPEAIPNLCLRCRWPDRCSLFRAGNNCPDQGGRHPGIGARSRPQGGPGLGGTKGPWSVGVTPPLETPGHPPRGGGFSLQPAWSCPTEWRRGGPRRRPEPPAGPQGTEQPCDFVERI